MFKQEFLSKKIKNNVQTRNCKLENINKKYSKINIGRFKLIFHIKIKN
jgi:mRNA-degrading endonuclease RelE of RelBE toxin-antitoxin system